MKINIKIFMSCLVEIWPLRNHISLLTLSKSMTRNPCSSTLTPVEDLLVVVVSDATGEAAGAAAAGSGSGCVTTSGSFGL